MIAQPKLELWQQKLAARGILDQALEADWRPSLNSRGSYWTYAIWNEAGVLWTDPESEVVIVRKKNMGTSGSKYLWSPSKPEGLNYYLLPDTLAAIREAHTVYIARGEPDHLAFRAAGQKNVLSWFGEGAIPDSLAGDLLRWGVSVVYDYPDCDDPGYEAAVRIETQLAGTGIEYHAYRLPFEFGSKGDINKLWIECSFDQDLFWDAIIHCDEADLSLYRGYVDVPHQPALPGAYLPSGSQLESLPIGNETRTPGDISSELAAAIEDRLGVKKYRSDGWSENFRCPFHDDDQPSAGWHRDKHILRCFSGCGTKLGVEVARQLNLLTAPGMPKKAVKNGQGEAQTQKQVAKSTRVSMAKIAAFAKAQALEWAADPKDVRGISLGFPVFDKHLSGILPTDLMVLIGRTGSGKSLVAMQIAISVAIRHPVLMYTTEMDPIWWTHRVASFLASVHGQFIYNGQAGVDMSVYYDAAAKLQIEFATSERPEPRDIWREAQAFHKSGGKLLVVDSLQNGLPRGMAKYEATVEICRVLADCPRVLRLPVLATCQANRGPSERKNKEPLPSDAEGGGIIEQSATRLITLHRPGYDMATGEVAEDPNVDPTLAYATIRKDRWFGKLGKNTLLKWHEFKFEEKPQIHVNLKDHEPYRRDSVKQGELL